MLVCYLCKRQCANTAVFADHLRTHELLGDIRLPIRCINADCGHFAKLSNLLRHINKFHSEVPNARIGLPDRSECSSLTQPSESLGTGEVLALHGQSNVEVCYGKAVENEATALVASLRAKSSVAHSLIPEVIQSCQRSLNYQAGWMAQKVSECIRSCEISDADALKIDAALQQCLNNTATRLDNLSTTYQQDKFFESHPLFVKPLELTFGSRYEVQHGKNKLVYDTFQYVCVEETLRSLLSNESYVAMILQNNEHLEDGIMREYQDGDKFKTAVVNPTEINIWIQIFYDGMGTSNPLRGQSTLTSVGVFYFVVKNLPTSYTSCHANVHLLSICYSHDLKVYGFEPVLQKFVAEMEQLRVHGFCGDFPIIGTQKVYVQFAQAVCDNLALNGLFGYIESFSADYFCTLCMATQSEIQSCYHEKDFVTRTIAAYNVDVKNINAGKVPAGRNHCHGIKKDCVLNKIQGFHVTENFSLDPMHIVLEGIIPVELSCILYNLINVKKLFKLAELNSSMLTFCSKNFVDKKNKPPEINSIDPFTGSMSPSMKAMQMWMLCRYLPLIIGHKVPAGDEHWAFLLHLLELVDIIYASSFTQSMITFLEQHIADHLALFVHLFGSLVNLKPKHHLLVHFPTIIRKSGPLIGMSCMRYELKNSFFKRSANIMCNFINVCKTLAYRHQYYALHSVLSNRQCGNLVEPVRTQAVPLCDTHFCDGFCEFVGCESTDTVITAASINLGCLYYKTGCYFVIGVVDDELCFGKAVHYASISEGQWYIVLELAQTLDYDTHLHSYIVTASKPSKFVFRNVYELRSPYPLYGHDVLFESRNCHLITLRSHVL